MPSVLIYACRAAGVPVLELFTPKQAAAVLGVPDHRLRRWVREEHLPVARRYPSGRVLIAAEALANILAEPTNNDHQPLGQGATR